MHAHPCEAPSLSMAARLLRAVIATRLRGTTRLSRYLAWAVPSLHRVPLQMATGQVVWLDMREEWCRDVLCRPPHVGPPAWEPDEQEVMRRVVQWGEIAFDIGAHFGEHCPLLADLVGPAGEVVAFEPNQQRAASLARTVSQRGNGRLLQYALSDRTGTRTIFVPANDAMSSLVNWTTGEAGAVHQVRCKEIPLDVLVERGEVRPPDFVKCDVEGGELLVFRGARRTLDRRDAPIVLYEANAQASRAFGEGLDAATRFLGELPSSRYAFYWVRPGGRLERLDSFPPDVALFNVLAVPAAKLDRLDDRVAA